MISNRCKRAGRRKTPLHDPQGPPQRVKEFADILPTLCPLLLLVAAASFFAPKTEASPPPGPVTPELAKLGNRARKIAMPPCGECHADDTRSGQPEALAVFDLRKPDWFHALDQEQLEGAWNRIRNKNIAPADRAAFKRFVDVASSRLNQKTTAQAPESEPSPAVQSAAQRPPRPPALFWKKGPSP